MGWFDCKHPFASLVVEKKASVSVVYEHFTHYTSHFRCLACGNTMTKTHAEFTRGVEDFLNDDSRSRTEVKP